MAAIVRAQEEEASSSTCAYTYDIFLSFRGEDTRKNFTDHLYTALMQAGYCTFIDDNEIVKGESFKSKLYKAINGSRISIIVFSKDYAFSPWCLDEVVMILECRKRTSKHVVLPVFYDVRPSEIRKQKGRTGEAFNEYVKQYKALIDHGRKMELMEKVKGWKKALEQVANLAGMELRNQADRHESRFIQEIINCIQGKLRRTPMFVAPYLIGMQSQAKNINKWLQDDSSKVRLLGICGMGGIGKTTMAKFIYDENYENFDCSCFLANVREMSQKPNGLASLQRQLLSSILNKKQETIYNVDEGIIKIKKVVSCKKVLLVIDDVDQINQLNALCGIQDWFYRGSKIIITTENERLLKPRDLVFKVKELGHDESVKLFSFYAFGEDRPIEGYIAHIESIVQICGGLPLALQVLGVSLSRRTVPQWASEVKKLQAIPNSEILNKLKISYDCLEENHDKRLFLDIACFFVGKNKDYTVKVLDSTIDAHADVRIQNLIDRSLLTINSRNKLIMHQLIRDMGRNIVYQESNDKPGERSRLWHQKDAYDVLRYKKGTTIIEGLALDMSILMKDDNIARKRKYYESLDNASPLTCIRSLFLHSSFRSFLFGQQIGPDLGNQSLSLRTDAFEKMEMLRLLKLNYTRLYGRYGNFPKKLIWLCWNGFPLKYMPAELSLENLVALDLRHSKLEEVWIGRKFLGSLKILNLSYSERLAKTPYFLGVPNLERLILKGCVSLINICESIEFLEKLNLLDLKDCKNLRMLPRNMNKLGSLETLVISGCSTLFVSGNDISGTSATKGLGKWWIQQPIRGPKILWTSLPRSLRSLSLENCNLSNDSLPREFGNLSLLKDLDLSFNSFHSLPECVTSLSSLQSLSLRHCRSLDSIFGLPSNLQKLNVHHSSSLRKITFQSGVCQLLELTTYMCNEMVELEGIFRREPIGEVDRRIIKNLGIDYESIKNLVVNYSGMFGTKDRIQGFYEYGIFSTYIPGGDIPNGFSARKKGSVISLIVPSLHNFRIQYLNICSVYKKTSVYTSTSIDSMIYSIKINNKTKDLTWMYIPTIYGTPRDDDDMTRLSQWNFGNQLEGGDEVVISVSTNHSNVKECAIKIIYEEDNGVFLDVSSTHFLQKNIRAANLSKLRLWLGTYTFCRLRP